MLTYLGEGLLGERREPCGDCVEIDGAVLPHDEPRSMGGGET